MAQNEDSALRAEAKEPELLVQEPILEQEPTSSDVSAEIKVEEPIPSSIVSPTSSIKKDTPSLYRRKEEKVEVVDTSAPQLEKEFDQASVDTTWREFGASRLNGGAGDAEKLVLSRELQKMEGSEISILLGSQLEITILEKIELDLVQYLRKELQNDFINLSKSVKEQKEGQKLYTSQDKYEFMIKENPALKDLKEKLGLDFEY